MGEEKAFIRLHGRALIENALELARGVTDDVRIVGPGKKFAEFAPVVEDAFSGRGPLGGIHAALQATCSDFNLVLAVDLPFVEKRFLKFLLEQAQAAQATVTLPRTADGLQPLCAVYRREFAKPAEAALRSGHNKIDALFPQLRVREIATDELARFAFDAAMFDNLNTREELRAARQRLGEAG
jgi:molybdopterin-guanine dinucleotide biosynthesis protein A